MILLKATEAAILTQSKEELEAVVGNSVEATATTITDSIMEVILNKDSTETSITTTTTTKEVREQEATTTTITTIKEVAIATMVTPKAVVTVTTVISLEENLNRPNKVKAVNSMDKMVPRD